MNMKKLKKELKFIHITKTAGSFIENIGEKNNLEWGRFHKEYSFWHNPFQDIDENVKEKYDWFVVVRNPYERILSEYYCSYGGIGKLENKEKINHSKTEFNEYLIKKIKLRNTISDFSEKGHYLEQYRYIDNRYTINILKFENLNKDLQLLFNKYDLDIDVNKYNKVNTKLNRNDNIPFSVKDFNKELIELIKEVYHKDFISFGYDKN